MDMAESVLATHQLTKTYGRRQAVCGLDLRIRRGEVFGFLGPNGAGKTTTIRMMLGLVRPTSGWVELLGRDVATDGGGLTRVGALVETPALYHHLSGLDNLRAFAAPLGGVPRRRLDAALDLVGLAGRERDRVRSYSLGMRQRLGVAVAMLHDQDLLLLDEPANGLDPAGIVEMRALLRRLAASGKTVFLSSHVLGEVQQVCDRVGIVSQGRLVGLAPVADLVTGGGEFEVRLADAAAALVLVRREPWGAAARLDAGVLVTGAPGGRGRDLTAYLVAAGMVPDQVAERRHDLERVFLSLTAPSAGGVR